MESKYYHLTGGTHSFLVLHDLLNPSEEFPIHTQSDWELIYIIRGCGTFVIGDQSQPFTKDEIFLIPPDMLHGWIFDNNPGNVVEDICLLFRKNLFKELSVTLPEIGPLGHLDSRQHTAFQLRGDLLKNVRHEMQEIIKTDSLGQLSGVIRILGHLALSDEMNPTGINRPLKKRDKKIQQIEIYVSFRRNRLPRTHEPFFVLRLFQTNERGIVYELSQYLPYGYSLPPVVDDGQIGLRDSVRRRI